MHSRSLILVSQRVDHLASRNETRDAVDQGVIRWLLAAGVFPLPVPNTLGRALPDWLDAVNPSAIFLSGGNDIGEVIDRDHTEFGLLDYAMKTRLPVLGICRGMQMLAHYAGASLVRVEGHVCMRHALINETISLEIMPAEVNSYHEWGLKTCPPDYEVLAMASDGTIEAIRHTRLPWEGWMWHPEREGSFDQIDMSRLKRLFG